jgi:hypothetical protein
MRGYVTENFMRVPSLLCASAEEAGTVEIGFHVEHQLEVAEEP